MDVYYKLERDIHKLNNLVNEIRAYNEQEMLEAFTDLIRHQSFLTTLLSDYNATLSRKKLTLVVYDLVLIWKFFCNDPKANKVQPSDELFESIKLKNQHFLKYVSGEPDGDEKTEIISNQMGKIQSEPLLNIIYSKYSPGKEKYDGAILLDLQSLVEYFDKVVYG
ncbi:MAG: hypothetical protein H7296_12890 [Bacteroidia bacterium]|nr:hypothetical protein [Bacteroidia bacterium]